MPTADGDAMTMILPAPPPLLSRFVRRPCHYYDQAVSTTPSSCCKDAISCIRWLCWSLLLSMLVLVEETMAVEVRHRRRKIFCHGTGRQLRKAVLWEQTTINRHVIHRWKAHKIRYNVHIIARNPYFFDFGSRLAGFYYPGLMCRRLLTDGLMAGFHFTRLNGWVR